MSEGKSAIRHPISCIVLAGGEGKRLGTDKAFLKIGSRVLIEGIVEEMARIGDEVIIVTNSPEKYDYLETRLVGDIYPGTGVLGGIYSGLRAAQSDYGLVVACDMPFLNLKLLRYMILLSPGYDVVIPRIGELTEPLHAIYSKRCLQSIERLLATGSLKIIDFFPEVRVRYVEEQEIKLFDSQCLSFFNINTPADLERARSLAGER
ncbi:MAG: molybdenum cofactor guanylyltransferase [Chloroflexi bacterium]|nr:molybdenum cofactor guanylyltransferase [Chloroflexota bacterium]